MKNIKLYFPYTETGELNKIKKASPNIKNIIDIPFTPLIYVNPESLFKSLIFLGTVTSSIPVLISIALCSFKAVTL